MSFDLNELRRDIDRIDLELLDLIEQRMAVSRKIGVCKREMGKDILDQSREDSKLGSLKANAGYESSQYIGDIYRTIFEVSRDYQVKPCFGLLGRTLGHSYSPQIHSLMEPSYSYTLIEREPEELDGALLFLVGIGVFLIVRVSYVWDSFSMLLEEGDYSRENKTASKKMAPLAGIYWAAVLAVYLGISFMNNSWDRSWIIWPVAAVAYGAVAGIVKVLWRRG